MAKQFEVDSTVGIPFEDEAASVTTLRDVMRRIEGDDASEACHRGMSGIEEWKLSRKGPVCLNV